MGVNIAVQPGVGAAPSCKTTKGVNDASMAPTRGVVDMFAVVLYSMLPFPVPLCPDVMLSQVAVLMASHGQSLAWNMMENLPLVESDPATMGLVGANVASQAMPVCVSMKVRGAPPALDPEPATVMAPVRGCELIFAAYEKLTFPGPVPFWGKPVIQLAVVVAVHVHVLLVVATENRSAPALACAVSAAGVNVKPQVPDAWVIDVMSLAICVLASPPPERDAVFVTWLGASAATFTVRTMAG